MPKTISEDLRWRAVQVCLQGEETQAEIGVRLEVGEASVRRWYRRYRETGGVTPSPRPGRHSKVDAAGFEVFKVLLAEHPDAIRPPVVLASLQPHAQRVRRWSGPGRRHPDVPGQRPSGRRTRPLSG